MLLSLYRIFGTLAAPLILTYLTARLLRGKEDAKRFRERLGLTKKIRPDGILIWVHAASVGESLSLLPLINRLRCGYPKFNFLVTTGTVTSAALMDKRLPSFAVHQFVPVDRCLYVKRFLKHWKPNLALWVESEFWPNLIIETACQRIPLVLVQGRVSPKAFEHWRQFPRFIRKILSKFSFCLAQSELDAERLIDLGISDVKSVGNLKLAAAPLPFDEHDLETLKSEIGLRKTWLAASTHPGEEEIIWQVHLEVSKQLPDLLTIVVPRHPERGEHIFSRLTTAGAKAAIRSKNEAITDSTQVYIADTIGELGLFYRLVNIVFVGKSFVNLGGQNLIEPALLDNAVLHGPYVWNFSDLARRLKEHEAVIEVKNGGELATRLVNLFFDQTWQENLSKSAIQFAKSEANVVDAIFVELDPFFERIQAKECRSDHS